MSDCIRVRAGRVGCVAFPSQRVLQHQKANSDLLSTLFPGTKLWMWLTFIGAVLALLVLDLGLSNKGDHKIGVAQSLRLSALDIALGPDFSGFNCWQMDFTATAQYLTAFVVEKTLALDSIFGIALIFSFFAIPRACQHRVLFRGIPGVIVLRGIMIAMGATLVAQCHWILHVFAVFLILTGVKMLFAAGGKQPDIAANPGLKFFKNRMRVTGDLHGNAFFVKQPDPQTGRLATFATPLFLALILIETADLIFAVE